MYSKNFLATKPPHRIGDPWQPNTVFFGRNKKIQAIAQQLQQNKAIMVLNGIGGMGKTTLANELCQQIGNQYNHVIWTNLQNTNPNTKDSLRSHLLYNSTQLYQDLNITNSLRNERDEDQKWAILLRALRGLGKDVLWVIDNAHQNDQATLRNLPDNCQILLTSREIIGDYTNFYVDELSLISALHLFKHYYQRPDDDQLILDVCRVVAYHPLSIELLAKTLNALPNKDASFLLQQLRGNGLNMERKPKIWTDYNQRQTYLNECLMFAFNLSELNDQKELPPLLRLFCLMPYQNIAYTLIQQLTQTEGDDAEDQLLYNLQKLSNLGWLKPNHDTWLNIPQNTWQMHPVIQDSLQQQLGRDEKMEETIASILRKEALKHQAKNEIEAQIWQPFLENIIKKTDNKNMQSAWCHDSLALSMTTMRRYETALSYSQKAINIAEQILPKQHSDMAKLYLNIANTYTYLIQYNTALTYYEKCRHIREQTLTPQHPDLATLYMNMAITYQELTQYDTALNYYEKSRHIREQILPPKHPYWVNLYNNMANTYLNLTDYSISIALTYYDKCRTIWEKSLPPLHLNLAILYANMDVLYVKQKQFHYAQDFIQQSIDILTNYCRPTPLFTASIANTN